MDNSTVFPFQAPIMQGDTFSVTVDLSAGGYSSSQYSLKYTFKRANTASFSITSTANPNGTYLMYATAAVTEGFAPGNYAVVATITNSVTAERFTLGQIEMVIAADLTSSAAAFDPRSPNQIQLDAIDAALAKCFNDALVEYTVGNRTFKKNKLELLKARQFYALKVRKENGLQTGKLLGYSFAPLKRGWF